MRVFTLWHEGDVGEIPWILGAVDQYTIDNNCELPPTYLKHRTDTHVRELILDVPEDAVRALFSAHSVGATVIKGPKDGTEDPHRAWARVRARAKLREAGAEQHAQDLEGAAEQAEKTS